MAGEAGRAPGGSASLVMRLDSGQVHVAMINRSIPIESFNNCIRLIGDPEPDA